MKKFICLLVSCLCLSTSMVFAANETEQSSVVTLDVPTSFTWTAPASLELIEGTPVNGAIDVTENILPEGYRLVISLADDNSFTVTSDEGAERTYSITKEGTAVNAGDEALSVPAGTDTASQDLSFSVEGIALGKKAGIFRGTANFTAEVKDNKISFTIDRTSYQAINGMTWGEWAESKYNTYPFMVSGNMIGINLASTYAVKPTTTKLIMKVSTAVSTSDLIEPNSAYVLLDPGSVN